MIVIEKTDAKTASQVSVRNKASMADKQTTAKKTSSAETAPMKTVSSKDDAVGTGATKTTTTKTTATKTTPLTNTEGQKLVRTGKISSEQRHQMICNAAYYRAERRGFTDGSPEQDWLDAEAEVDAMLSDRS